MTTPVREAVVLAVIAALEGLTGFSGLTVAREYDAEIETYPFVALYDVGQDVDGGEDEPFLGFTLYRLNLEVEAYAGGADGAAAASAINQLSASIVLALLAERSLGGVANDVIQGAEVQEIQEGGSVAVKAAKLSFSVLYQTVAGDPFTAG